jgi:hypothetical protein
MIEERKLARAIFLCGLFAIMTFNPFWVEVTHAQQMNTQISSTEGDIKISYTNSSFTIESTTNQGNLSFTFEWTWPRSYIMYNGTCRPLREIRKIAFTDKTAKYRIEYWVPILLMEYIDIDGNNILFLNDTVHILPDVYIAGYKIDENIGVTNITTREDANGTPTCEWTYTQLAGPIASNIHEPWERFPTVKENFHYYPLNGTLKMDIILQNYRNHANEFFKPENASSRIFLGYGVRYVSLEPENVTITAVFDDQELVYDQINKAYPTTSNVVVFTVNGVKRGFFDFGGKVTIDNNPNMYVNGSIGPTRSYWYYQQESDWVQNGSNWYYQPHGGWLEIGLNYAHVNQTLIHDPYLGLYSDSPITPPNATNGGKNGGAKVAITFPFEGTLVTAVISVIICTVAIVDYFKTKRHHLKPTI